MKLERFIVFAFNNQYPAGGISDIKASHKEWHEAKMIGQKLFTGQSGPYDNVEVLDSETGKYFYLNLGMRIWASDEVKEVKELKK